MVARQSTGQGDLQPSMNTALRSRSTHSGRPATAQDVKEEFDSGARGAGVGLEQDATSSRSSSATTSKSGTMVVYVAGTPTRQADAVLAAFALPCTALVLYFGGTHLFWTLTICASAVYATDAIGALEWSLTCLWGTGTSAAVASGGVASGRAGGDLHAVPPLRAREQAKLILFPDSLPLDPHGCLDHPAEAGRSAW